MRYLLPRPASYHSCLLLISFVFISFSVPGQKDPDHDGIKGDSDLCPYSAEDKDGYMDWDGCPDEDNDADGIPDVSDRCPDKAEDFDGWQDGDGCPDTDNDGDGIPDTTDRCRDIAGESQYFGCTEAFYRDIEAANAAVEKAIIGSEGDKFLCGRIGISTWDGNSGRWIENIRSETTRLRMTYDWLLVGSTHLYSMKPGEGNSVEEVITRGQSLETVFRDKVPPGEMTIRLDLLDWPEKKDGYYYTFHIAINKNDQGKPSLVTHYYGLQDVRLSVDEAQKQAIREIVEIRNEQVIKDEAELVTTLSEEGWTLVHSEIRPYSYKRLKWEWGKPGKVVCYGLTAKGSIPNMEYRFNREEHWKVAHSEYQKDGLVGFETSLKEGETVYIEIYLSEGEMEENMALVALVPPH